ncbi:MAG: MFS transporter [Gammaproteobacteria bacterium]|nr:MFS transporter [Gammaproteobacteria bacterium]
MFDRFDKQRLSVYLQVIMLALAASVIYSAPYLRQLFKTSLLEAFGLDELELGNLSTTYAVFSILCYIPGGWLADRVNPRILVVTALFASAATFAWYATLPGYAELLVIHALWGIIGTGVLWAAMFKHVRLLAGGDEQGRMFGTLEGARGLFEAILLTVATFVFGLFATRKLGMVNVILIYSVVATAIGVLMLFVKNGTAGRLGPAAEKIRVADVMFIVRQPTIWLLCIILTAVYHVFWATIEFPSFAETGGFGMPLAAATALGAAKLWMRPVGGVLAGILGDRITNVRLMQWLFLAAIVACLYLAFMETTPAFAWTLWVFIFPFGLVAYGLRGVFWALLYDCPVPARALGTAIGFISIMGYSSDAYIPQVSAWLHVNYATGTAYQLFYAYVAGAALTGLGATWLLRRIARAEAT